MGAFVVRVVGAGAPFSAAACRHIWPNFRACAAAVVGRYMAVHQSRFLRYTFKVTFTLRHARIS